MSKFIIQGGQSLSGEITVMGSKNATTPILSACLLTQEKCILHNVPRILDIYKMIEILQSMGVTIEWIDEHSLSVQAGPAVDPEKMNFSLVGHLRSSILLLGSLLARFKKFKIKQPGGCIIGARPIGVHFDALEALGAQISQDHNFYYFETKELLGTKIVLKEFSVTATENAMMAASLARGTTIIRTAAIEPHVQDLGRFLRKMGAKIERCGFHTIQIQGVEKLTGATHTIQPDYIEAGTFAILAGATKSDVLIKNVNPDDLDLVLEKLKEAGIMIDVNNNNIHIKPTSKLKELAKVEAREHPGLPTDLQAPFSILATQTKGTTLIHDTMYEGRLNHINELIKMGANAIICDPHRAIITGPTPLYGREINSLDLRSGATMIIAAILAQGQSVISNIEQIDRGYEKLEERLTAIGANIIRQE